MNLKRAILVIDLAFGDSGKGTVVDYLTRRYTSPTIVRFNGGPQAAHNVITPDGRHHTFAQFGSGTFLPGVRTVLSAHVLIEPYAIFNEAAHLESLGIKDPLTRLLIHADCPVITPIHQAANRIRELARGPLGHGTCGMGIGETMQDSISHPELILRASELCDAAIVRKNLQAIRDLKVAQLRAEIELLSEQAAARRSIETITNPTWIAVAIDNYASLARSARIIPEKSMHTLLQESETLIFEGAQGVLLDGNFGFHPHTTWSTTTFANADALLDEMKFSGVRYRMGVLRTYFTRHGAGPFVTEDSSLAALVPETHNRQDGWQGRFRVGVFDAVAARYALRVVGRVDGLAMTHLDRLSALPPKICDSYSGGFGRDFSPTNEASLTAKLLAARPIYSETSLEPDAWLDRLRDELSVPVTLTSHGPTALEKSVHNLPDLA